MADKETPVVEIPRRAVYRVSFVANGQPQALFVVAYSAGEAAAFTGVQDGSAAVSQIVGPVEVSGVDSRHAPVIPPAINVAPPQPPKQFSDAEVAALRRLLAKG